MVGASDPSPLGPDIQTAEIDDNAVTLAKTAHGTADQFIGFDGSGVPVDKVGTVLTRQRDELAADETTTSTTYVDSGLAITLANRTGGFFLATTSLGTRNSSTVLSNNFRYTEGATDIGHIEESIMDAGIGQWVSLMLSGTLDGDVINIEWLVDSGTGTIMGSSTTGFSHMEILEIS